MRLHHKFAPVSKIQLGALLPNLAIKVLEFFWQLIKLVTLLVDYN